VTHTAANVHDSKLLEEAVDAISPIRKPRVVVDRASAPTSSILTRPRTSSMLGGLEEERYNPAHSPARHRVQREAGALQVGSGENSVLDEPLPALEGALRAAR
jgi:hypothetical protein